MEKLFNKLEAVVEQWQDSDEPECSGNILCERRSYHKCEYRPLPVNAYVRQLRKA
jgi:hypothetical protein